jgi:lactoylglutathione lyase
MKVPVAVARDSPSTSVAGPHPVYAQCMLRVADPKKSREFYERKLGMTHLMETRFDDLKFSLDFYAYTDEELPNFENMSRAECTDWLWSRPYPTMELTHNWDSDEKYVNGNTDPGRGFGHIGIIVDDAAAAVKLLADTGVKVVRQPAPFMDVGVIAFVEDPDGYWCEIIQRGHRASTGGPDRGFVGRDPVFAQVMTRVTDPMAEVAFYQKLGMKFIAQMDFPEKSFSLYFLAYADVECPPPSAPRAEVAAWLWEFRGCTIELTHNWVDESTEAISYASGNEKPFRGFGHVGIIVDDVEATANNLEKSGHKILRKPGPFQDVAFIAFVASPTGYWIELIKRTQ